MCDKPLPFAQTGSRVKPAIITITGLEDRRESREKEDGMKAIVILFSFGAIATAANAQSRVSIVASGNIDPTIVYLAPGEVTDLYIPLRDIQGDVPLYQAATGFPLPTTMAGLSVALWQFRDEAPLPVPILAVRKTPYGCGGAFGLTDQLPCRFVALTIMSPRDSLSAAHRLHQTRSRFMSSWFQKTASAGRL